MAASSCKLHKITPPPQNTSLLKSGLNVPEVIDIVSIHKGHVWLVGVRQLKSKSGVVSLFMKIKCVHVNTFSELNSKSLRAMLFVVSRYLLLLNVKYTEWKLYLLINAFQLLSEMATWLVCYYFYLFLFFQISLFIVEWSVASDHARYPPSFVQVIGSRKFCAKLQVSTATENLKSYWTPLCEMIMPYVFWLMF